MELAGLTDKISVAFCASKSTSVLPEADSN